MTEQSNAGVAVQGGTAVHVFVNRRKVEFASSQVTGEEILRRAGFSGNDWDLFLLQGEGDPTGGTLIQFNQTVTLKNGEHFRVIPGHRTFGC